MGDKRRSSDPRNNKKKKKSSQHSSSAKSNRSAGSNARRQSAASSAARRSSQNSSQRRRQPQRKRRKLRFGALLLRILFLLLLVLGITYGVKAATAYFTGRTSDGAGTEESSGIAETETSVAQASVTPATEEPTTEEETTLAEDETGETEETKSTVMGASAFSMVFAGDVWLEEIAPAYDEKGIDGILDDSLLQEMQSAGLTMINEEFPFGTGGKAAPDKQYTFKVDPSYVSAFQDMGVDIVSLANNHVLDFGTSVLTQTFKTLDNAGIEYVGAGDTEDRAFQWKSFELNGKKVAVLSASRVLPTADWNVEVAQPGVFSTYNSKKLVKQIAAAKEENDVVVVYVHWGIEKSTTPEDYQKELAHEYVDAGADLVIGAHPHVLQGIEYYNNTPIVYSLGNFMFHESIESTALLRVDVDKWNNMNLTLIPAYAEDSRTRIAKDEQAQEILQNIEDISINVTVAEDGRVVVR